MTTMVSHRSKIILLLHPPTMSNLLPKPNTMLQALFILLATSNQLQLAESHPPAEPTFFSAIKKYPPPHRETTGASTSLLHEDDLDEQLLSSFPNRRHLSNCHDEHDHDHDTLFVYDRPRPRPKRREDVPPATATNKPILQHESRYINYGEEGHPYERVRRLSHDDNQDGESREEILRNLQGDGLFKPLRIHFDTTELDQWAAQSTRSSERVAYLSRQVLPRMAQTWSSALSVVPVMGNLRIDYSYCPFGDPLTSPSFQPQGVSNADLVIFVTANSAVCSQGNSKVLASAYSCFWDQFERPIAGTIDFCLEMIDSMDDDPIAKQAAAAAGAVAAAEGQSTTPSKGMTPEEDNALKLAVGTAVHEIAHVLGVTSADMLFFYDSNTGHPRTPQPQEKEVTCMTGERKVMWVPDETTLAERYSKRGVRSFEITLPTVRQVVRNHFNCQRLTGAALENQPTNEDCFGSHFDERYFFTESLSAVLGGVQEMLSSLTFALLHDSGWYKPDYSVAMISPFGHGAGCEFVEEACIVDGNIPAYSKGSFCNTEYKFENGKFMGEFGCDPTHTSLGICDLVDYNQLSLSYTAPPAGFQYYPGRSTLGGLMDRADYCPTFSIDTVTCQEVPGKLEEMLLPQLEYFAQLAESSEYSSRCFNTDSTRPICLDVECDDTNYVMHVKAAGQDLTCSFDGQTHLIPGTGITFECPKIALMCPNLVCPANCAGHGICDWTKSNPECICFDVADKTPGCFNSFISFPPEIGWNKNVVSQINSAPGKQVGLISLYLILSALIFT